MNEPIVIATKTMYKKAMYGFVSNGGGLISMGNGKSLKITALNNDYVELQILEHGIGIEVKTQSWQKSKVIKEKVVVEKKPQQTLKEKFSTTEEVKTKNLFEL